jgi:sec-independent protein translocase protein TatC
MTGNTSSNQTLFDHLLELRSRILKAIASILIIFICLVAWSEDIYQLVAQPLLDTMPAGTNMIATDVASPFFAPFKLTFIVAIFLSMPLVLYQIWAFIAPGLYRNEKRLIAPLMFGSTLLFYCGVAFVYFVVFPLAFAFFSSVAPQGVTIATDISSYLDFVLSIFFAFGLAFEIPIAIVLLCWSGVTTTASLKAKRPYIVVAAFVIGMLLTPPDVISQTLLALPMLLLFELGLFVASFYTKKESEESRSIEG